ncbi:MAG: hypothetical protein D6775_15285 [Caldilineae bacterium]|nr:MAG: hypothetical protein D6775_15285 [Caldilineae bacterium]
MKAVLHYLFVLALLLAFGYGLYLLGQNAGVRAALLPKDGFPAFEGRRPPEGLFEGRRPPEGLFGSQRPTRDFRGERRGDYEFDRFDRGGGFSLFGLLRLGGTLFQMAVIVALVVGLEWLLRHTKGLGNKHAT